MKKRNPLLVNGALTKRIRRVFDKKPMACNLYVTDRCNLDCHYCTEYDNTVPHPPLEDLKRWIDKIVELGCIRIGLQGGEPLTHPDIVEIVRYCAREKGLVTTIITNGFLLNGEVVEALNEAGLSLMQISVDRMTPIPETRKSLKTMMPKLKYLENAEFTWTLAGVLFEGSTDEARQVLDFALDHGIPVQARLVHAGVQGEFTVNPGDKQRMEELLDYQMEQKRAGRSVRCASTLFDYQKDLLHNRRTKWTCLAGYKYLFVSARGTLWLCSMNRDPDISILDVTPEMLEANNGPKPCQRGCGVYCTITESMFLEHPVRFLARELKDEIPARLARRKRK